MGNHLQSCSMQKLIPCLQVLGVMAVNAAIVIFLQPASAQSELASSKHVAKTGKSPGAVEMEYPNWFYNRLLDFKDDVSA